jgi:hypothetical protein
VRVRRSRQSLLTQNEPIDFWVVLDEAVLRRPVGGSAVMWRQLSHLTAMANRPNVTIQVLPFAAGAHAGMDGTFAMLLYEESASQSLVFAANAAGGVFLEKDQELQRYALIFDRLRSCSLAPDDSNLMIATLAEEELSMCAGSGLPTEERLACPPAGCGDDSWREGAPDWRKSTRSGPYSDNCVEVAVMPEAVGVRDSTDPAGPVLCFSPDRWQVFVQDARFGRFDLP